MISWLASANPDASLSSRLDKLLTLYINGNRDNSIAFGDHINEIIDLCKDMRNEFLRKSPLLELEGNIHICGDIHGQFDDLLEIFRQRGLPSQNNRFLFLGDYVDRGRRSLETILYLYSLKKRYPDYIHLLRGNHESSSITKIYGFYDECKRRIPQNGIKVWKTITDTFNCLPIAAIVGDRIFCVHGGLSPELLHFQQIASILRPTDIQESGLMCDLLWSDPTANSNGWDANDRGVSYTFGKDIIQQFCATMGMDLLCRAHQVVEDGYEFFANRNCLTIFSAPNYGGDFNNAGAILYVDECLRCEIITFHANSYHTHVGNQINQGRKSVAGETIMKKGRCSTPTNITRRAYTYS